MCNTLCILSFFARIAGAASVYSVEGSNVAQDMQVTPPPSFSPPHHQFTPPLPLPLQTLDNSNGWSPGVDGGEGITVLHSREEQVQLPVQHVDILISEPMGVQTNRSSTHKL